MRERSEVTLPDGVQLHVEVSGPADAPVTVVLLHGWCLDRRTWHHQIAALETLTENAPRIITYDTRGHGRSGSTRLRSATLGQLGDDLAEVLRRFAPTGPVVLAGHSMGGMAIMEYAHTHPRSSPGGSGACCSSPRRRRDTRTRGTACRRNWPR